MPLEMFAHSFEPRPVYQLFVYARPSNAGKSRSSYVGAVRVEAWRRIRTPIASADVEISMLYSSLRAPRQRLDIDNTLKPTLDALCGIAFADDRQVRAVTARLIDRTGPIDLGFEDRLGRLLLNALLSGGDDVVLIHTFRMSGSKRLGAKGPNSVSSLKAEPRMRPFAERLGLRGSAKSSQSAMNAKADPLDLVLKAVEFAATKHKDQRRKDADASPYINHPIALARILIEEGRVDDPIVIAAALLHDTIEDTDTTYQEVRGQFGEAVADIVAEVTDTKWLKKGSRKRLQVMKASKSSDGAKLVKLADKIANLRDIIGSPPADWSRERRCDYFDWAKQVVDGLRGTNPKLERKFDSLYRKRP